MAFDFDALEKKRRPRKEARKSAPETKEQAEYRERAKADTDRYKNAVDGDFHSCFCFSTAENRDRFADMFESDSNYYCFGDRFSEIWGDAKVNAAGMRKIQGAVLENPFMKIPYDSLSLEEACFAEADALLESFESLEPKEMYRNVYDSRYYVCVIFDSRKSRDAFLRKSGLIAYGDVFVDGDAALKAMK